MSEFKVEGHSFSLECECWPALERREQHALLDLLLLLFGSFFFFYLPARTRFLFVKASHGQNEVLARLLSGVNELSR